MELNREHTIKNLAKLVDKYGENGSYNTYCTLSDTLALIKKLAEENEALRGLYEHNSQLAIDSERKLEQCKKSYEDELSRVHMLLRGAWDSVEAKDRLLGTIKADTVQKMQEKLKAELDEHYSLYFQVLSGELIDRIAKEVLEEN